LAGHYLIDPQYAMNLGRDLSTEDKTKLFHEVLYRNSQRDHSSLCITSSSDTCNYWGLGELKTVDEILMKLEVESRPKH